MTYKCEYFDIRELLPPSLGRSVTPDNEHRYWGLFDDRLLRAIDEIRRFAGPMYVNTWSLSSERQLQYGVRVASGLRIQGMDKYSMWSQHAYGRAVDAVFAVMDAVEVQEHIRKNLSMFPFITGLEVDVSHLHCDTRNFDDGLLVFNPQGVVDVIV